MNTVSGQQTDIYFDNGTRIIRGPLTEDSLNHEEWYPWFTSGKAAYKPSAYSINKIKKYKDSLSFVIVMGTWCGDTKRQVPRLAKILQLIQVPASAVSWYGVDMNKKSNNSVPADIRYEYVPHIVVKYNGRTIGTIVEAPEKTLEKDIWKMLKAAI